MASPRPLPFESEEALVIQLHTVPTPNGHKVSILLEELGLPYEVIEVDLLRGEQFAPAFLALNPNNKCPVLVDPEPEGAAEPLVIFESGAILVYLAEKTGRFLPEEPRARYAALQWLMFQMSAVGPLQGQAHHFIRYAPVEQAYALERYRNETHRQLRVLEHRLGEVDYLAGEYGIADIALWPWVRSLPMIDVHVDDAYPALARWFHRIEERPAVARGKDVIHGLVYDIPPNTRIPLDEEAFSNSFGDRQYADHFGEDRG